MGRWVSAPLAACLLALAAAGCTGRAISASTDSPARSTRSARASASLATASPNPSASAAPASVTSDGSARPLPAGTAGKLPAGTYYLLAGRSLRSLNVWEVGPGRALTQLTHNPSGHGIDAFAASAAGMVLADAAEGTDRLARWTRHGLSWLRHSVGGAIIRGSSPDIRGNGTIGYVTPPSGSGTHQTRTSRSGPSPRSPAGPRSSTGSAGRWTARCSGRTARSPSRAGPGRRAAAAERAHLRRRPGHDADHRGVRDSLPAGLGSPRAALAVAFPAHRAELLFGDGRRQPLPRGWQPLAWNQAGTQLLMQSSTGLGIWSATSPGQVRTVGIITPGMQILQAVWLAGPAPM